MRRRLVRASDPKGSIEYESVVDKLHRWELFCGDHELVRFNPLTDRGRDGRIGGCGRPHSKTSRDHSAGNGNQADLAHHGLLLCRSLAARLALSSEKDL